MPRTAPATLAAFVLLLPALASCTSTGGDDAIAIEATDSECDVATTTVAAGGTSFKIKNSGSKVTEVYVYGRDGDEFSKVVTEQENIGPGTSRTMSVDLAPGDYEIACKPGQTGDGIRTAIEVTGEAASGHETGEAAYDRELEFTTDGTSLTGGAATAGEGEKIEFKLANNADAARTFEIKDPSGSVAGEVADIEPGEEGELVVELDATGEWQVIVEGSGVDDLVQILTVSAAS
jgi:uncharacterized cupredoxin-like copper-binding protein